MGDLQTALGAFGRRGRGGGLIASIERRVLNQRAGSSQVRRTVRFKVRYRDPDGRAHRETFARRDDAVRRRTEIEASLVSATWLDPAGARSRWPTGRRTGCPPGTTCATTWARLETTTERQLLPRFGSTPLRRITNAEVGQWVRDLLAQGSPRPPSARPCSRSGSAWPRPWRTVA